MINRFPMEWDNTFYRLFIQDENGQEYFFDYKKKEKLEEKLNTLEAREDLTLVEVYLITGKLLDRWE